MRDKSAIRSTHCAEFHSVRALTYMNPARKSDSTLRLIMMLVIPRIMLPNISSFRIGIWLAIKPSMRTHQQGITKTVARMMLTKYVHHGSWDEKPRTVASPRDTDITKSTRYHQSGALLLISIRLKGISGQDQAHSRYFFINRKWISGSCLLAVLSRYIISFPWNTMVCTMLAVSAANDRP